MKNLFKLLCATSIATLLTASNTHAVEMKDRPFLGLDVQENFFTFYGTPGASVFGGYRWDQLGFELGYTRLQNDQWGDIITYKSDNIYLDGLWFYPVSDNWDLKTLAGIGLFRTRNSNFNFAGSKWADASNESSLGFRLGLGMQYNISNYFSTGISYKIQTNPDIISGSINILALNLTYHFK